MVVRALWANSEFVGFPDVSVGSAAWLSAHMRILPGLSFGTRHRPSSIACSSAQCVWFSEVCVAGPRCWDVRTPAPQASAIPGHIEESNERLLCPTQVSRDQSDGDDIPGRHLPPLTRRGHTPLSATPNPHRIRTPNCLTELCGCVCVLGGEPVS